MNIPKQAPSIQRSLHRFSSATMTGRVRPAGFFDIIKSVGSKLLGSVLGGAGGV